MWWPPSTYSVQPVMARAPSEARKAHSGPTSSGRSSPAMGERRTLSATSSSNAASRSEEHTSELQSPCNLVCRLLLEKKKLHNFIGQLLVGQSQLSVAPPTLTYSNIHHDF